MEILPWITDGAIEFLKNYINKNSIVLEFGIGKSTIWFANNVKNLVSIEHDKYWFKKIQNKLLNKTNVELILHTTSVIKGTDLIKSCYSIKINKFPDNFFDLVLIDGRNRVKCFKKSDRVLKPNGFMMLDNSERKEYQEAFDFYKDKKYFEHAQQKKNKDGFMYPNWKTSWWQK